MVFDVQVVLVESVLWLTCSEPKSVVCTRFTLRHDMVMHSYFSRDWSLPMLLYVYSTVLYCVLYIPLIIIIIIIIIII